MDYIAALPAVDIPPAGSCVYMLYLHPMPLHAPETGIVLVWLPTEGREFLTPVTTADPITHPAAA